MLKNKNWPVVFGAFGVIFVLLSILVGTFPEDTPILLFDGLSGTAIFVFIGIGLLFAQNKALNIVGYTLNSYAAIVGLSIFMSIDMETYEGMIDILGLVAVVFLLASSIVFLVKEGLLFFNLERVGKLEFGPGSKVSTLKRWKKLEEKAVITDKHYEDVKDAILTLKPNDKVLVNIEELRLLLEEGLATITDLENALSTK